MSFEHYLRRVMSGAERGPRAAALRAALALAEPFYTSAVRLRNRGYDRNPAKVRRLPRPVVSVGNLTAGGTGKTPVVRWLAGHLRDDGRRVAVLSRGYGAAAGTPGDELRMLDALLDTPGQLPVILRADPDRFAAGEVALADHPDLDAFLLDDGFQHRALHRDLDIVLLHAAEPFGFGHVLPRGLLREPVAGLRRAGAVVLTHATAADGGAIERILATIRRHNSGVPVYRCVHRPTCLREPAGLGGGDVERPLAALAGRRVFAFCGIGNPAAFESTLVEFGGPLAGRHWFPDHHAYSPADLARVHAAARQAGATVLVTTEKDWVKLAPLPTARDEELPLWRLDVAAEFLDDDGPRLLEQVNEVVKSGGAKT